MKSEEIHKSLVYFAFKAQNLKFNKCLSPQGLGKCTGKTIRSHSIQNKGTLELIHRDGQVVILRSRMDNKSGVVVEFKTVGRNEATTFTGLCRKHDNDIYEPIEKSNIDIDNQEHLFLLAYRAVTRHTHATINSALRMGTLSMREKELNAINDDVLTDGEKLAHIFTLISYRTYLYKQEYDKIYLNHDYDSIHHKVIIFPNTNPTIAVCDLFNPRDNIQNKQVLERIALNIFPINNNVIAILSYLDRDTPYIGIHINNLLLAEGEYRKYLLSKMVLRYCENIVISPEYYDSLSEETRQAIIDFFIITIENDRFEYEDERLHLF
jgi:hypothetical protein